MNFGEFLQHLLYLDVNNHVNRQYQCEPSLYFPIQSLVKFRLAGAHNGKSKVNGLNGNGESDSGNGKGASLRDLIGSEQKVKMSDIIDACVEDSMEDMKDDSNAKLTHFIPTTDLEEDRYVKHMLYIEGERKVDEH